jgi:hypothetical protein
MSFSLIIPNKTTFWEVKKMQKISRIGVMSAAKVGAVLGLIEGIIAAILMFVGYAWVAEYMMNVSGAAATTTALTAASAGMLSVMIIIGGLVGGFIGAAVTAFLYNVTARFTGGVEIDLK